MIESNQGNWSCGPGCSCRFTPGIPLTGGSEQHWEGETYVSVIEPKDIFEIGPIND